MPSGPGHDVGQMTVMPSVRRGRRGDAVELAQLINRAYQIEASFLDGERTNPDEVARLADAGHFVVLERGDGSLGAAVYVRAEGRRGFFGMLSVAPDLQNLGLGRRLVAVAEALCAAMGCTEMALEVINLREELPPWYRRLGYREVGIAPYVHRPPKKPCHFILMEKQLVS